MQKITLIGVTLLGVLLMTLSHTPYDLAPLRWVGFLPLLFLLTRSNLSFRKKVLYTWLMGFLYLLWQYSMFTDLYPLDWLGISNNLMGLLVAYGGWILFSLLISLSFLIVLPTIKHVLLFPFVWTAQEFARSFLYSLIVLGSSSTLGDNFSYGFTAYTAHSNPVLLFLSPFLGIYGLTFLIALINVGLFLLFTKSRIQKYAFASAFVLITLLITEFFPSLITKEVRNTPLHVVSLQGDNPFSFGYTNEYFVDIAQEYSQSLSEALTTYPETNLVVAPENSQLLRTLAEEYALSEKEVALSLLGTSTYRLLAYGDFSLEKNTSMVALISNDPRTEKTEIEKSLLMPFGEYQPYLFQGLAKLFGESRYLQQLLLYRNTTNAPPAHEVSTTPLGAITGASCSEMFSPPTHRDLKKKNTDILLYQQRLGVFHGNTRVFEEGLVAAKVHAAMLGSVIVGSVDGGGYSYIIDERGVLVEIGDETTTWIYAEI